MAFGRDAVVDALKAVEGSFKEGELAYLALTSKIENPIRDRFALRLQADAKRIVGREWGRVDVALLEWDKESKEEKPLTLFEFKAIYSFDPIEHDVKDLRAVVNDIDKEVRFLTRHHYTNVEYYGVLLATHPLGVGGELTRNLIKYKPLIEKNLQKLGPEGVRQKCCEGVERFLNEKNLVHVGPYEMDGGQSFGTPVKILWWVIGPLYLPQDWSGSWLLNK